MTITRIGTLPVSSINLGLAAAPAALTAEATALGLDVDKLTAAGLLQIDINGALPPDPTFLTALQGALDPTQLAAVFSQWPTLCVDINTDLNADWGLVSAQLAIVEEAAGKFEAGVNAGSLTGWTYAGRAQGFGTKLRAATAGGFGGVDPDTQISALIIGCASFSSWGSFSVGFNTGSSADDDLGETTTQERLQCQGTLNGGQWSPGVLDLFARLDALRLTLAGRKAAEGPVP